MMQIPFWQELGIDPILLGQPKVYITSSDNNYLLNTLGNPPSSGDILNQFNRFNDSAFNLVQASTTNRAVYTILAGQPHPYGYISWANTNLLPNGYYRAGTTTDMSFLHQAGSSSTIYWIHKNNPSEATGTTKVLMGTTISSGQRGAFIFLLNSGTNRIPTLQVYNDTPAVSSIIGATPSYVAANNNPVVLYSWRNDLSKSVGQDACWVYVNGILSSTNQMTSLPSATAASTTVLNIGNRNLSGLRFNGYVGDFIIFNTIHDEATHLKVCNYLKRKWGIS